MQCTSPCNVTIVPGGASTCSGTATQRNPGCSHTRHAKPAVDQVRPDTSQPRPARALLRAVIQPATRHEPNLRLCARHRNLAARWLRLGAIERRLAIYQFNDRLAIATIAGTSTNARTSPVHRQRTSGRGPRRSVPHYSNHHGRPGSRQRNRHGWGIGRVACRSADCLELGAGQLATAR